jgi:hypothetical protein
MHVKRTAAAAAAAVLLAGPAPAATIAWTDWQTATGPVTAQTVTGQITVGSTVVNVT